MGKEKSINVNVLIHESHRDNLTKVASALKAKGFSLKQSMGEIGILAGSVPETKLSSLSEVPGVASVEKERTDYETK